MARSAGQPVSGTRGKLAVSAHGLEHCNLGDEVACVFHPGHRATTRIRVDQQALRTLVGQALQDCSLNVLIASHAEVAIKTSLSRDQRPFNTDHAGIAYERVQRRKVGFVVAPSLSFPLLALSLCKRRSLGVSLESLLSTEPENRVHILPLRFWLCRGGRIQSLLRLIHCRSLTVRVSHLGRA